MKTTALPAETMAMVLLMIVAVGLVVGVIAATTPKGANSVTVMPSSPVTARGSRSSGPSVFSVTSRFLRVLSSARPRPVSSCAARARSADARRIAARTLSITLRRASRPWSRKLSKARRAAATASSTSA